MGLGSMLTAFEWGGALLGLLGAFLLATHSRVSRYGWLAFLAANMAMIRPAGEVAIPQQPQILHRQVRQRRHLGSDGTLQVVRLEVVQHNGSG